MLDKEVSLCVPGEIVENTKYMLSMGIIKEKRVYQDIEVPEWRCSSVSSCITTETGEFFCEPYR